MMFDIKKYKLINFFKKKNKYDGCGCGKFRRDTGNIKDKCPSIGKEQMLSGCYLIFWDYENYKDSAMWN